MGWRERFGADDERAQIAARARALLDAAGGRPSPAGSSSWGAGEEMVPPASPLPSPRGGWVPPSSSIEVEGGRHAATSSDAGFLPPVSGPLLSVRSAPVSGSVLSGPVPRPLDPERAAAWGTADHDRSWRDRVRFDPGRRGLVAVAAVVVIAGSVAGGVMFRGGPSSAVTVAAASGAVAPSDAPTVGASVSPAAAAASPAAASSAPAASGSPTGTVTVDVAGLVVHPGVYTLPSGSRVEDALAAAGGAQPGADLSTLNRARVLTDGEQLPVGVPGAVAPAVGSSGATVGGAGAGGPVDLNTAGLTDLDALPGVGPVLAQAILDWRTEHGRFASVDDLDQVSGIGPATFADLKDLVTV